MAKIAVKFSPVWRVRLQTECHSIRRWARRRDITWPRTITVTWLRRLATTIPVRTTDCTGPWPAAASDSRVVIATSALIISRSRQPGMRSFQPAGTQRPVYHHREVDNSPTRFSINFRSPSMTSYPPDSAGWGTTAPRVREACRSIRTRPTKSRGTTSTAGRIPLSVSVTWPAIRLLRRRWPFIRRHRPPGNFPRSRRAATAHAQPSTSACRRCVTWSLTSIPPSARGHPPACSTTSTTRCGLRESSSVPCWTAYEYSYVSWYGRDCVYRMFLLVDMAMPAITSDVTAVWSVCLSLSFSLLIPYRRSYIENRRVDKQKSV